MSEETRFRESKIIPFDIETTGFTAADSLTSLTLKKDGVFYVWLNEHDDHAAEYEELKTILENQPNIDEVQLFIASSELEVLESLGEFMNDVNPYDYYCVAYNGEVWKGGFDLPFLRTLMYKYDLERQPFDGMFYIDLYPLFQKQRINTTAPHFPVDELCDWDKGTFLKHLNQKYALDEAHYEYPTSEAINTVDYSFEDIREWFNSSHTEVDHLPTKDYTDLVKVHEVLNVEVKDTPYAEYKETQFDPFKESVEAIEAYESGNYADLLCHNVADVQRTDDLSEFLNYVPSDDISWKELVKNTKN